MHERTAGVALVLVSAFAFGSLGVLAKVAYDGGAEPVAVLLLRFSGAAACFFVARAVRRRPRPAGRTMAGLAVMGLGYFGQSLCYFTAVRHAPPGLVALLLYCYPALVVGLGALLLGHRIDRRTGLACAAAVVGTALVVAPSVGAGDPLGVVLGLGAAVVYSGYILLGSRLLPGVDPVWASAVIMASAACGFGLVAVVAHPRFPASAGSWAAVAALTLVCTVLAVSTFLAGLARLGPAPTSALSSVEPVASVALSAVVFGERVGVLTCLGGLLVLGAVVALARAAQPAPAEAVAPT